jgi:hypothetical protein
MIEFGGVEVNQRHRMQKLGILGACFEGLPAAELSFEKPSSPHVLMDSSELAIRATIQVARALLSGRSAFATIHRHATIDLSPAHR